MAASDHLSQDQFTGPEVWRGLKGEHAAEAADANRRGEAAPGRKGSIWVGGLQTAMGYAQRHQGDRTGVMLRGRLHKDAKPDALGEIPAGHVRWDPKNYTVDDAVDVLYEQNGWDR